MAQLFSLFSSSAGNSTCLSSGSTTLLIDAGGNCKKITESLALHGIGLQDLQGIVLTHEHSDHISALKVLLKRCRIPVYGTACTLDYLESRQIVPPGTQLCCVEADNVIGDIHFSAFPTPHDAAETCGYVFTLDNGKRIGFATDLGEFTQEVFNNLSRCEMAVLESNYDLRMLEVSGYPYPLKRRIRSATGHLSNDDCASAAVRLALSGVRKLLLAHTSKENNMEELAYRTTLDALSSTGAQDLEVEVAPKYAASPVLVI